MKNLHNDTSLRLFLFNATNVHYQTGIATNNNLVTLHQAITLTLQLSECSVLVTSVPESCHIRYERDTRLVVHFRIVSTGLLWRSTGLIAHVHFRSLVPEVPVGSFLPQIHPGKLTWNLKINMEPKKSPIWKGKWSSFHLYHYVPC